MEKKNKQYIVKDGDDIFSVAKKLYDGDVRKVFDILELNEGVCRLYSGLVLDLPEGE